MRDELVVYINERLPRYTIAFVSDTDKFAVVDMQKKYITINRRGFDHLTEQSAKWLIEHEIIHAEGKHHGKHFDDQMHLRKIPLEYTNFHISIFYDNMDTKEYVFVMKEDEMDWIFESVKECGGSILVNIEDVYALFNLSEKPDLEKLIKYTKRFFKAYDLPFRINRREEEIILGIDYGNVESG